MIDESTHIDITELLNFNGAEIKFVCARPETASAGVETSQRESDAKPSLDLDAQADLLRGVLNDFKALAEGACDTALRQAQRSAQVEERAATELVGMRLQLKEKNDALEARDRTLCEYEAGAKEKIESLESMLRDKDAQLDNCQARSRGLLGEIDGLNLRLNDAATAIKLAETRFREFAEHQQSKITELQEEIKAREELIQGKDAALRQLNTESRASITALERRLQTVGANLESKEAELRENQTALRAAASGERNVAQLIQELAAESQTLMAELRAKHQLVAGLENTTPRPSENGIAWNDGAAALECLL